MNNRITCSNCLAENPPYAYTCKNCNSFLRERVFNIDLWNVIGLLIESPKKAMELIVFSEHKNFISFLLIFIAVKLLVNTRFMSLISLGTFNPSTGLYLSYLIVFVILVVYLILFSICFTSINKLSQITTRFRDNFALLTYSLLPNVFGIIFLFIIELVVFGEYLFSINPTPFVIKGITAYIFAGAEFLLIVWSFVLSFKAFKVQTDSLPYSIIYTFVFYFCLGVILFYSSKIIFTI
ncbi:MAG: zinc ribbon domain-containing protein [Ignavibacteriaceae bacterium]